MISAVETDFVVKALQQGLRADGRSPIETRKVRFQFERQDGKAVAHVQLGRTRVMCATTADIIPPFPDRPAEGFINFSCDFSRMAAEEFENGRPPVAAVELGRIVERVLKDSRAVDTEALCIVAGEKVWSLRCALHVLDHGGNLIDAASLAALASLLHFRRADVSVSGQEVTVHKLTERAPVPLSVHHTPVCVTFGMVKGVEQVLVDPTDREELVMHGRITYALNAHEELCVVHKLGGLPLSIDQLLECSHIAAAKAKSLVGLMQKALAAAEDAHTVKERARHAAAAGYNLATPHVDTAATHTTAATAATTTDMLLAASTATLSHLGVQSRVPTAAAAAAAAAAAVSTGAASSLPSAAGSAPAALPEKTMWDSSSGEEDGGDVEMQGARDQGEDLAEMASKVVARAVEAGASMRGTQGGGEDMDAGKAVRHAGVVASGGQAPTVGGQRDAFALDSDEEEDTCMIVSGFADGSRAPAQGEQSIYSVLQGQQGAAAAASAPDETGAAVDDLQAAIKPLSERKSAGQRRQARKQQKKKRRKKGKARSRQQA